jgi:hypothetical protein
MSLAAGYGWGSFSRALARGLARCWLITPPWCLKKILFADLDRFKTPEARATIVLACELYKLEPEEAAKLLHCEQIEALLNVSLPPVAGGGLKAENPNAVQGARPPRLNYDHILIFSYGRTGSTLLMGLLNAIPGVLIRGENHNALYHLFQFFDALSRTHTAHPKAVMTTQPWFGAGDLKLSYMLADLRRVAREILLGQVAHREQIRCLGFKEIRYLDTAEDFDEYVGFLKDIFPNALYIVNRREHAEVTGSDFWSRLPTDAAVADLRKIDQLFDRLRELHSHVFELNYSDISLGSARLRALYDTIGAHFSPEEVEAILGLVHGYAPVQERIRQLAKSAKTQ